MTVALFSISKLFIYLGLAGFAGCFLSVIISLFYDEKSSYRIELMSTFLLGSSFAGVLFEKFLPGFLGLNILLSLSCGSISTFLSSHFFHVSLKKTFENEIEV